MKEEKESKAERKFRTEVEQRVLGIYEDKRLIYGMGAAGAVAIFIGGGLAFTLGSSFVQPKFVIAILLVVIGASLIGLAADLYRRAKEREADMRRRVITKALEDNGLRTGLVKRFILKEKE